MAKSLFRGTRVEWDSAGAANYVQIGKLRRVTPSALTRESIDVTDAESANAYMEKLAASFRNGGTLAFSLFYEQAEYSTIKASFDTDTVPSWRFNFPLIAGQVIPARFSFSGSILELGIPELSTDDGNGWMVDIVVDVTGKPFFTTGG